MEKLGEILLSSPYTKAAVIVLFIAYLICAIIGITQLEAYQNTEDLAPNDSYLRIMYAAQNRYFNTLGVPMQFIMDKALDYSDEDIVEQIEMMVINIRNDESFINNSDYTTSWIYSYYE